MDLVYQFSETKWNLYTSFIMDAAIGIAIIFFAFYTYDFTIIGALLSLAGGWVFFTFIEYAVHAWLFHIGSNVIVRGHGKHHKKPQGFDNLPFFAAGLIAVVVYFIIALIIPQVYALLVTGAILLSYVAYTGYHFAMHRVDFTNPYGRYMQKFHYVHHIRPKKNHGVTVPIWDLLFRTYEPLKGYTFDADLKLRPDEKLIRED